MSYTAVSIINNHNESRSKKGMTLTISSKEVSRKILNTLKNVVNDEDFQSRRSLYQSRKSTQKDVGPAVSTGI